METNLATGVLETDLNLPLVGKGKVRDIYAVGEDKLLIVVTDRISAFDVVFAEPIPGKGKVLNQISAFWFRHFENEVPHHMITTNIDEMGLPAEVLTQRSILQGRSMLVKRTVPVKAECVIRGYITGSGWKDYLKTGKICGHQLPKGLLQCEKLDPPIFTPATKADEGHDENIDWDTLCSIVGESVAKKIRDFSHQLYEKGRQFAGKKGILIADTKFEFGVLAGEIILIDEALTPDSSRFWDKEIYKAGVDQPSFDKQIVRNFLEESGWNKQAPAPKLPQEVITQTTQAYNEAYRRLTGSEIQS